jgi:L-threonylcarbamoyladenylate synthase
VMQTILTSDPLFAAQFVRAGEIVAFPTETVYGLAANIFAQAAINKIFLAKGRPTDNPLIAHVSSITDIQQVAASISPAAEKFIAHFFPGPLTVVLPKQPTVPQIATAGLSTIGVRMPDHALAQAFIKACGVPLVAPSANLSGKPSPTTWQAVHADLAGKIAAILQGEQTIVGLESTVVDCTSEVPLLLRAGGITLEQLQAVVPDTKIAKINHDAPARSPGLKYRHYAPTAKVMLVRDSAELSEINNAAFIGLHQPMNAEQFRRLKICQSYEEYAHLLFSFFRECDAAGVEKIFCEAVAETGLGLALMDRLRRAAQN